MTSSSDCGIRCYTERKSYCKDLHKWGKNLLYMIGLECVAKKLTGRRSWAQISPFIISEKNDQEKENSNPVDWAPVDLCPVCSGRRFSAMEGVGEEKREEDSCSGARKVKNETQEQQTEVSNANNNNSENNSDSGHHPRMNFDFLFSNIEQSSAASADLNATSLAAPVFTNPFSFFGFGSPTYFQQLLQWSSLINPAFYSSPQAFMPTMLTAGAGNSFDLHQQQNGFGIVPCSSSLGSGLECGESSTSRPATGPATDQPLDLSMSQKSRPSVTVANSRSSSESCGTKFQPATAAGVGDFLAKGLPGFGVTRKYDKNALDEAVRSVRRGEMSVHRAGSYYGVPHSTLEYKVKERNLLRPKKKEAKRLAALEDGKGGGSEDRERKCNSASPKKSGRSKKRGEASNTNCGDISPLSKEILDCLQDGNDESPAPAESLLNGNSAPSSPAGTSSYDPATGGAQTPSHGTQRNIYPPSLAYGSSEQAFFASDMMRRLQAEAVRPAREQMAISGGSVSQESRCATQ